jgi:hypothetical protein
MSTSTKKPTRAKLIKMWVAALRSGKYEQADGTLHEVDRDDGEKHRYCCLGVACEVAREAGLPVASEETKPKEYRTDTVYYRLGLPKTKVNPRGLRTDPNANASELPEFIAEAFGIYPDGSLRRAGKHGGRPPKYESLVMANDDGESFRKIADRIERGQLAQREDA